MAEIKWDNPALHHPILDALVSFSTSDKIPPIFLLLAAPFIHDVQRNLAHDHVYTSISPTPCSAAKAMGRDSQSKKGFSIMSPWLPSTLLGKPSSLLRMGNQLVNDWLAWALVFAALQGVRWNICKLARDFWNEGKREQVVVWNKLQAPFCKHRNNIWLRQQCLAIKKACLSCLKSVS